MSSDGDRTWRVRPVLKAILRSVVEMPAIPAVLIAITVLLSACGDGRSAAVADGTFFSGGPAAFRAKLDELRGKPVVVNQWASWCGPCRAEFPYFERLAREYEGSVAFLGVNSQDAREDAAEFLAEHPVPFPHFYDRDAMIARVFRGGRAWPTTAFYGADGELEFTHQGAYRTQDDLRADIERYAIGG